MQTKFVTGTLIGHVCDWQDSRGYQFAYVLTYTVTAAPDVKSTAPINTDRRIVAEVPADIPCGLPVLINRVLCRVLPDNGALQPLELRPDSHVHFVREDKYRQEYAVRVVSGSSAGLAKLFSFDVYPITQPDLLHQPKSHATTL